MAQQYIIYCDESDSRGTYFSNFYGGALVRSKDFDSIKSILETKKHELNLFNEIKWSRVTENYCDKYINLINTFLDFVFHDKIKIRIMFTQNIFEAKNLSSYHREHEYFILYYQFIKHAFGLQYSNDTQEEIKMRVYFDWLPDTKEKAAQFKSFIQNLSSNSAFRSAKILIMQDQLAEIDSKDHVILQCLDVILGAIHFRLNDKHKEKSPEKNRRGKRTIAKEKLYKHILQRIQEIYPKFNIGTSTATYSNPKNLWEHRYRHWLFKPRDRKINLTRGKNKKAPLLLLP